MNLSSQEYYVTAKSGLNIRESPNLNGEKIGKLLYKQKANILEKTTISLKITNNGKDLINNWGNIESNKIQGYVF